MYQKFLGVAKLSEKSDLPIIGEDFNHSTLPFVQGSTEVRQVRFYWERKYSDPHNHLGITTIASFAKSHGREYVSEAGSLLDTIRLGDLELRMRTKFQSLQKTYRQTTGKKSTKPGGELTQAKRDNRARGVNYFMLVWRICLIDAFDRNLKYASVKDKPFRQRRSGVWQSM